MGRLWLYAVLSMGACGLAGCTTTTMVNGQPVASTQTAGAAAEADARKRAAIRLQLAATYYQKGQFNIALEEIQRALQLDPDYADAYNLLGLINMDLGKHGEAEANFQRALRLDADSAEIQNNYGWFLCQSGREREAIAYFRRAAASRIYATPAMPLRNAGICSMRIGDNKAAEEFLRRSFELDAANPVTKFHLARLYLSLRELERARFYYGLLPRGPEATAEVLWLGVRLARAEGNVRAERELANELRRRFPDSREAAALRREAYDD
ncbi:MAG: type IV pilus biogenesis/stability protein PilW [Burkholderiaceae bacterium]|nr:type IV pilus biogenesis/stability protein PilW [Burkholderiaceae bacterium]